MFVTLLVLKLAASTFTEYRPGTRADTLYKPESLVTEGYTTPVSWLVIVTVAPATTAPLLSVTVPSKLAPYWAWTKAVNATMLTISSTTWTAKLGRLMKSPRANKCCLRILCELFCEL